MPRLLEQEAHCCVMLGVLSRLTDPAQRRADEPQTLMALVEDDHGQVATVATRTPPFPLLVSPSSPVAAVPLATHLADNAVPIPGVNSEMQTARVFADAWSQYQGVHGRLDTRLGVYQVETPLPVPQVPGIFRQATTEDAGVLGPFAAEFAREIRDIQFDPDRQLRLAINEHRLFVWCDESEKIVSMAASAGPTPNGIRINFVFTPAARRGRGYASNCVAALTRHLLQSGRRFVFLFTDLANPTSNGIYQRIGYRYLGEQHKILFD